MMAVCPQCGAQVEQDAVVCGTCNALVTTNSTAKTASDRNAELNAKLERALHRTQLLSYAAAGLGLAIFAMIIIISFL